MTYFKSIWHSIQMFGLWDRMTLRAIFPPFYGWDIGCGYCAFEGAAKGLRRCPRGRAYGWKRCGV